MKTVGIGIVGTGGMAGAHAKTFAKIPGVKLVACCDVSEERVKEFAKQWKIPAIYTDYSEMIAKAPMDGLANVTPDAIHAEIALAALGKGVPILSEKPLASTLADARKMAAAARKSGAINMVNFSYRNSCALQAAAKEIAAGKIGRVIHVESSYLQSWLVSKIWGDWHTKDAFLWRLSTKHGSMGTLGDIGCHIYDLTAMLCGDIAEIYCRLETFDKGYPNNRMGEYILDANDSFISNVKFASGAVGTVHSSRWATGQCNSLRARVYGDKGAIELDLDAGADIYKVCIGKDVDKCKWKTVKCKATPDNYQRFVTALRTGKNDPSDFENGAKVQAYLHYSMESDTKGKAVKVKF
jgi:predicted dehydrogenase